MSKLAFLTPLVFSQIFFFDLAFAEPPASASAADERALVAYLKTLDQSDDTQCAVAFVNLSENHFNEAIVQLAGSEWCGSGGCTTLVLEKGDASWERISEITVTRLPIKVLSSTSHGWHDIAVQIQGGGIRQPREAVLKFNGRTYPANPTTVSAKKPASEASPGETALTSHSTWKLLNRD
jgi:hypothetical protein